MTAYRLLVTGSRSWADFDRISYALGLAIGEATNLPDVTTADIVIVHGACPTGADDMADRIATDYGWRVERHPADWPNCGPRCNSAHRRRRRDGVEYCPTAGHRRNQEMVDLGADLLLGFVLPESRGTRDAIRRAKAAGIPVRVYDESGALADA